MAVDVSPAVERAATAAAAYAARGGGPVRPADWLLGLLDEDEGQPAGLVTAAGLDLTAVRALLEKTDGGPAPPADELYAAALERAAGLTGEPTLTTNVLFLTAAEADPAVARRLAALGLDLAAVERSLRSDAFDWSGPPLADFDAPSDLLAPAEPPFGDESAAARVVDANLNRAREALRVVEDYCRFVGNDADAGRRVKDLRHRLAAATAHLPAGVLLAARDTAGDVGTAVTAPGEYDRGSPADVAAANLKRLQEALRSAEEFGKLFGAEFARAVERVRYESYTLERDLLRPADVRARLAAARLYLLVSAAEARLGLERTIAEAAAGGVGVVQLREKNLPDGTLLRRAEDVRRWTRAAGVLFIVNDRPDIARLADADGVHVGQDDLPPAATRRVVGPDRLVGVSTHAVEQVRAAVVAGADYLGAGPTFPSRTKPFAEFPGLPFVRAAVDGTAVPVFALGGIGPDNVAGVIAAGCRRVAVGAAVARSEEPRREAEAISRALNAGSQAPSPDRT